MTNQNLFEAIERICDFIPLQSEMQEIIDAYEKDKLEQLTNNMTKDEILKKIEEITDRNYKTFRGTNEAELHTREDIADLIEQEKKAECIAFMKFYFGETDVFEKSYEEFKQATT